MSEINPDSDQLKAYQASLPKDLESRIMDIRIAKSEAEWWASREIDRLRSALAELKKDGQRAHDESIEWQERAEAAESERIEWVKRAEAAEVSRNDWKKECEEHAMDRDKWRDEYRNLAKFANDYEARAVEAEKRAEQCLGAANQHAKMRQVAEGKVAAYKMESKQDRKELDGANALCRLLEEKVAALAAALRDAEYGILSAWQMLSAICDADSSSDRVKARDRAAASLRSLRASARDSEKILDRVKAEARAEAFEEAATISVDYVNQFEEACLKRAAAERTRAQEDRP